MSDNSEPCNSILAKVGSLIANRSFVLIIESVESEVEGETAPETKARVSKMIKKDNEARIKNKKIHGVKKASRRSRGESD
jgi:hypothetical protein